MRRGTNCAAHLGQPHVVQQLHERDDVSDLRLQRAAMDVVIQEGRYYERDGSGESKVFAVVPRAALAELRAALGVPWGIVIPYTGRDAPFVGDHNGCTYDAPHKHAQRYPASRPTTGVTAPATNVMHVTPVPDEPEHRLDGLCWCQPVYEDVPPDGRLCIHRRTLDSPHIEGESEMTPFTHDLGVRLNPLDHKEEDDD